MIGLPSRLLMLASRADGGRRSSRREGFPILHTMPSLAPDTLDDQVAGQRFVTKVTTSQGPEETAFRNWVPLATTSPFLQQW